MTIKHMTILMVISLAAVLLIAGCGETEPAESESVSEPVSESVDVEIYTDENGDTAPIPDEFTVSEEDGERNISTGLVVTGPDKSQYVWVPTDVTRLEVRDFGSYFSGGDISEFNDETDSPLYQQMVSSVEKYDGFYISRYEISEGEDGLPVSRPITESDPGRIMVQISPQDASELCQKLYSDNDSVAGFFPWGINWDTTLQWLIDSGSLSKKEVADDSTSWGNYGDDTFSVNAGDDMTGIFKETSVNNIYDLAGNNWEWTQERCGSAYVMRGGGVTIMGGSASGDSYPAAIRDPLPGNSHHPNVTIRTGLFVR